MSKLLVAVCIMRHKQHHSQRLFVQSVIFHIGPKNSLWWCCFYSYQNNLKLAQVLYVCARASITCAFVPANGAITCILISPLCCSLFLSSKQWVTYLNHPPFTAQLQPPIYPFGFVCSLSLVFHYTPQQSHYHKKHTHSHADGWLLAS